MHTPEKNTGHLHLGADSGVFISSCAMITNLLLSTWRWHLLSYWQEDARNFKKT